MDTVYVFKKGQREKISEHFYSNEFGCVDAEYYFISKKLIFLLEDLREYLNNEFGATYIKINSGYRTPEHNKKVGGVKNSWHLSGLASDIVAINKNKMIHPKIIYDYLDVFHLGGLGKYNTFVHVDVRPEKARWQG